MGDFLVNKIDQSHAKINTPPNLPDGFGRIICGRNRLGGASYQGCSTVILRGKVWPLGSCSR